MDQRPTYQIVHRSGLNKLISLLLCSLFLFFSALANAQTALQFKLPPNHLSQYELEKYGTHVADMHNKLLYHDGVISYESTANAKGLAALLVSAKPKETSTLNWPHNPITEMPKQISYDYYQDKGHKKNQQMIFGYAEKGNTHIKGKYKHKSYILDTDKVVFTRQLIPLLMSSDLQLNPDITHNSFYITNKGKIQKYSYTLIASEDYEFKNKMLPVLKFKIQREGSQRMSYAWLSKAHYYLPLKIEQYKNGDLSARLLMTQLKLKQDE